MKFSKLRQRLLKQRRFRQLLIMFIALSLLLGILIVPIEKNKGNILNVSDGLWWAITTVTGVGFGDYYPVTNQGRVIGVILEVSGVTILGLIIAIIGTSMNRSQEEFYWNRLFDRLNELETEVQTIRKQTGHLLKDANFAPPSDDPLDEERDTLLS